MNRPSRFIACTVVSLILSVGAVAARPQQSDNGVSLRLSPETIEMGAFYGGARLRVDGSVPAGSELVIVIRGADTEEVFNKKRRAGPIWVNSGKVHISGVPSLFLALSSSPVRSLLASEIIEEKQLDQTAIRTQMKITPESQDHEIIRDNYLALKARQGIHLASAEIEMGESEGDRRPFSVELPWPKKAPPASYLVTAYEVRDGSIAGSTSVPLHVMEIGFPSRMAYLAKERPYLYGTMTVLIALMAGLGINFIAGKLGGKAVAH